MVTRLWGEPGGKVQPKRGVLGSSATSKLKLPTNGKCCIPCTDGVTGLVTMVPFRVQPPPAQVSGPLLIESAQELLKSGTVGLSQSKGMVLTKWFGLSGRG